MMSTKHSKMPLSRMSRIIRQAKREFEAMPKAQKIEILVKSGGLTREQADRAIRAYHEQVRAAAEAAPVADPSSAEAGV